MIKNRRKYLMVLLIIALVTTVYSVFGFLFVLPPVSSLSIIGVSLTLAVTLAETPLCFYLCYIICVVLYCVLILLSTLSVPKNRIIFPLMILPFLAFDFILTVEKMISEFVYDIEWALISPITLIYLFSSYLSGTLFVLLVKHCWTHTE